VILGTSTTLLERLSESTIYMTRFTSSALRPSLPSLDVHSLGIPSPRVHSLGAVLGAALALGACASGNLRPVSPMQAAEEVAQEIDDADPHSPPQTVKDEG
jgi:hypothetical protein